MWRVFVRLIVCESAFECEQMCARMCVCVRVCFVGLGLCQCVSVRLCAFV